jgi:phenylalanyl-tRNA synthetase beta subunit
LSKAWLSPRRWRATDRTLTDDEVNAAFAKLQQDITADGRVTVRA